MGRGDMPSGLEDQASMGEPKKIDQDGPKDAEREPVGFNDLMIQRYELNSEDATLLRDGSFDLETLKARESMRVPEEPKSLDVGSEHETPQEA